MAGGKGTRLRPLTCNLPKPMVPLLHKPVMEYSIELFKMHGITEIAVTLQYLGESIRNYFGNGSKWGVNLHYFYENTPLGTAGSIKNAESFLDETFVIISGDALTDFNLSKGIGYHNQKGAMATIFMKQVENPREYGLIMANDEGRIQRFIEKPRWNEIFSDTVNTGIYVMEPDIFSFLSKEVACDFSKDLFPNMLRNNEPLYGFLAAGYWSDIGNLNQYRQTHYDMLNKRVNVPMTGRELFPNVWVGTGVSIEDGTMIIGPVSIGDGAVIRKGAKINPYTIIGSHTLISDEASLKRSIIWNDVFIGNGCELRGVTVANGTQIEADVSLYEHSVVGNHCKISKKAQIKPSVKIWPNKSVYEEAVVHTSLIWGRMALKSLFGKRGVTGIPNVEITPDYMSKLACAYGGTLQYGSNIVIGSDDHRFSLLIKSAFMQGLHSSGISTIECTMSTAPVVRYTISDKDVDGGIFISLNMDSDENEMTIEFYDQNGYPVDANQERKIENAFWNEDYRRAPFDMIGTSTISMNHVETYSQEIIHSVNRDVFSKKAFSVALCARENSKEFLVSILEKLNCSIIMIPESMNIVDICEYVRTTDAEMGILIDGRGEHYQLIDHTGVLYTEDMILSLHVLVSFLSKKNKQIAIPINAPSELDELANQLNGKLVRTKAERRDLMVKSDGLLNFQFDAVFAIVQLLELLSIQKLLLPALMRNVPVTHMLRENVSCPWDAKGRVMQKLVQDIKEYTVDLLDGIKIYHPEGGWTLILPDIEQPMFTIYSQAENPKRAKEFSKYFIGKIRQYQKV